MSIGSRIRNKRIELGLTQEELAKIIGYKSKSTINKIEMGINDINQSKVVAFANALKTTPSYLMGWEDAPHTTPEPDQQTFINFTNPTDALKFILKQEVLMAYGGYDLNKMSDEDLIGLANDILLTIKISTERRKNK